MSSSTVSTTTPTRHQFDRRVEEVKPSKTDMNFLVMDYLISEGYPVAASKFAAEANIKPGPAAESIEERVEIKQAICSGDIQTAIEMINELNPEILDRDHALHFSLLRLHLIELIRTSLAMPPNKTDITPALQFATEHLAPRASTNSEFLEDLERTMALLIFSPTSLTPELKALLDPTLRQQVANHVMEAILRSHGQKSEARIKDLVRLRAWLESKARDAKKDIPDSMPLGLDGEFGEAEGNGAHQGEDGVSANGNNQDGDAMVS
ncbi:CTLH/CRA C-terminal to lish motif domain-containing protein [Lineolata rhizophorae]|uniref:CTLH/CRA C-terminal to lish motif domain-containing protein n=1 Tax=Lineolata rhizophorae TaxID=578093 RepID=A0A6A6P5F6_9PEZI|nr:CTLH/CRA C-terminal to lish motif domain-containing protein [Lineolata rhizophorae]